MELIFFFVLGAAVGFWIAQYMYMGALQKILDELGITEDQLRKVADNLGVSVPSPKPQTIEIDGETFEYTDYVEVRVEKLDDVYYAYDDNTNQFIAQESDPSLLLERLVAHFPANTRVNIDPANGGKYLKDLA